MIVNEEQDAFKIDNLFLLDKIRRSWVFGQIEGANKSSMKVLLVGVLTLLLVVVTEAVDVVAVLVLLLRSKRLRLAERIGDGIDEIASLPGALVPNCTVVLKSGALLEKEISPLVGLLSVQGCDDT